MSNLFTSDARHDGVLTLFKFMGYPLSDSTPHSDRMTRRGRVETLLRNGELYFPTAQELNDPFETSPHFQVSGSPEELALKYKSALREVYGPQWGWSHEQISVRE